MTSRPRRHWHATPIHVRNHPLIACIVALVWLQLAACGGDDDTPTTQALRSTETVASASENVPMVDDAVQVHAALSTTEELGRFGGAVTEGETFVYTSGQSVANVAAFYASSPDGWQQETSAPAGPVTLTVISGGDSVASLLIMSGADFKSNPSLAAEQTGGFDRSQISDSDTVVVISRFTCAEATAQACLGALITS